MNLKREVGIMTEPAETQRKIEEDLADLLMLEHWRKKAELIAEWMRENVTVGNYWHPDGYRGKYADVFDIIHNAYFDARKHEKEEVCGLRRIRFNYERKGVLKPVLHDRDDLPDWSCWQDVMKCHTWVNIVEPFGSSATIKENIEWRRKTMSSSEYRFNDPLLTDGEVIADPAVMCWGNRNYRIKWHDHVPEFLADISVECDYSDGQHTCFHLYVVEGGDKFIRQWHDMSEDAFSANMGEPGNLHKALQRFYENLFDYVETNKNGTYKTELCNW